MSTHTGKVPRNRTEPATQTDEQAPESLAPVVRASRKHAPRITLDAVLEQLPHMPWPMRATQFQELLGVNRTTAVMRLNNLVDLGYLRPVGKREFGLANEHYGLIHRPKRDSVETLTTRLPDLAWPMDRRELSAEIAAPTNEKKGIIDALLSIGVLRRLSKSEFIYDFVDARQPKNLRLLKELTTQDYIQLLHRLPERFTNTMFKAQIPGYDAKHTASTLNRFKDQDYVRDFGHAMYARDFEELPLTFGLGTFAEHFGMSAIEAAEFLYEWVEESKISVQTTERRDPKEKTRLRPEVRYTVSPEIRVELENLLHHREVSRAVVESDTLMSNTLDAPDLPWPMTVPDYMKHYNLGRSAAWRSINLMRLKGLVAPLPERRGAYSQYVYTPDAPMSAHEARRREKEIEADKAALRREANRQRRKAAREKSTPAQAAAPAASGAATPKAASTSKAATPPAARRARPQAKARATSKS